MATTNETLLQALRDAATSLFGSNTTDLEQAYYDSVAGKLAKQQEKDTKGLREEMAQRGVLDSGAYFDLLNMLGEDYIDAYSTAASDAKTNAYTQYLQSLLAGGQLSQIPLGNAVNWGELGLAQDQMNANEDAALYGGIGSLLGSLGLGQGGLTDLLSSATTGVKDLLSNLFGTKTTPTSTYTKTSASNPVGSSNNWAVGSTRYTPATTYYKQSAGQGVGQR